VCAVFRGRGHAGSGDEARAAGPWFGGISGERDDGSGSGAGLPVESNPSSPLRKGPADTPRALAARARQPAREVRTPAQRGGRAWWSVRALPPHTPCSRGTATAAIYAIAAARCCFWAGAGRGVGTDRAPADARSSSLASMSGATVGVLAVQTKAGARLCRRGTPGPTTSAGAERARHARHARQGHALLRGAPPSATPFS
jgi:hypothetical protein